MDLFSWGRRPESVERVAPAILNSKCNVTICVRCAFNMHITLARLWKGTNIYILLTQKFPTGQDIPGIINWNNWLLIGCVHESFLTLTFSNEATRRLPSPALWIPARAFLMGRVSGEAKQVFARGHKELQLFMLFTALDCSGGIIAGDGWPNIHNWRSRHIFKVLRPLANPIATCVIHSLSYTHLTRSFITYPGYALAFFIVVAMVG